VYSVEKMFHLPFFSSLLAPLILSGSPASGQLSLPYAARRTIRPKTTIASYKLAIEAGRRRFRFDYWLTDADNSWIGTMDTKAGGGGSGGGGGGGSPARKLVGGG